MRFYLRRIATLILSEETTGITNILTGAILTGPSTALDRRFGNEDRRRLHRVQERVITALGIAALLDVQTDLGLDRIARCASGHYRHGRLQ